MQQREQGYPLHQDARYTVENVTKRFYKLFVFPPCTPQGAALQSLGQTPMRQRVNPAMYQEAERVQSRRRQTDTAIQLAKANRWEEAVATNRAILKLFPGHG